MAQFGSAGAAPRRCRLHWLGAVPLLLALSCGGSTPGPYESLTEPGANAGETAPPQRPNVRSLDPVAANGEVERASASPGLAALPADPGTPVSPELGPSQQEELQAMRARLDEVDELGTDELLARYPSSMTGEQGYDPLTAIGVDLLQASDLALNDAEQAVLESSGLVISERQSFPTFTYGYDSIYAADLPLFVSADSILNAVHRSYDRILQQLERQELLPSLDHMLAQMREGLAEAAIADPTRADMDLYLAVATSLLDGNVVVPIAGAEPAQVELLFSLAQAAAAPSQLVLFGERREIDFSQMRPRGHYDDNGDLARYFRAMMWLGRIDLRLVEALPDQTYVFNRRQLEAAVALRDLMTPAARDDWSAIDSVIAGFVGEADGMTLTELDALLSDLELTDLASLADMSDTDLAQAIVESGYGTPRVASQLLLNGSSGPMALTASFSLFGQRYLIDSHVLSNVTYDRVPVRAGAAPRLMPDPLDVAFAALGNDQAAALLEPELRQFGYAPELAATRELVDAHPDETWQSSLRARWLGALRTLSASQDAADAAGLPAAAMSEPWGRRLLNTQLASWAELRRDVVLYAAQSYSSGGTCEYPDAYVDPYPAFFDAIAELAEHGQSLADSLEGRFDSGLRSRVSSYFAELRETANTLGEMAEHQRTGTPHSAEHLEFINQAVRVRGVLADYCLPRDNGEGWYPRLFFGHLTSSDYVPASYYDIALEYEPTTADVHTQPTDDGGNAVGRVLHVGTGMPRLMVVTVETCSGPRAYVGLASSYYEHVTQNYQRLTDSEWETLLGTNPPPDVPWLQDLVVH